jgi:uncharacterized Zn finger protein
LRLERMRKNEGYYCPRCREKGPASTVFRQENEWRTILACKCDSCGYIIGLREHVDAIKSGKVVGVWIQE